MFYYLWSVVQIRESGYDYNVKYLSFSTLFFTSLVLYVYYLWTQKHKFVKSWNYPGPLNLPVIGNLYLFLLCRKPDLLHKLARFQEKYSMGLKIWFGTGIHLLYLLNEPAQIEKILSTQKYVAKDIIYNHFKKFIGEGIFTAPVEKWKKNRKLISPAFNQQILNSFVEIFNKNSLILNEVLSECCDGKEIDIEKLLCRCTLDTICETAMGVSLDIQKTNTYYADTVERIFVLLYKHAWSKYAFWDVFAFDKKLTKSYIKKLNELGDKIIELNMERNAKREASSVFIEEESPKRFPFLDHIRNSGEFSPSELREEVNVFLLALTAERYILEILDQHVMPFASYIGQGFLLMQDNARPHVTGVVRNYLEENQATDTSTSGLTSLFAVLGMFPEIQQNIYEEMIEVLGNDKSPEDSDLSAMVYTERVIKETLRLFPPVPHIGRTLETDADMGPNIIPKGAHVYFGLVFIHRNPKYWPDPLKFDPDRFLPEEVAKRHPCTFLPFSYGPRNCIGMKYGMMSMKVILATVIRKFRINCEYKKIEDIMFNGDFILRFRNGAKVSMTPRI